MSKHVMLRHSATSLAVVLATMLSGCATQDTVSVNGPPPHVALDPGHASTEPAPPPTTTASTDVPPDGAPGPHAPPPPGMLIHLAANQTFCIDAAQDRSAKHTPVRLFMCHGQVNQRWTLTPGPSNTQSIGGAGGLCLDVRGPHAADGTHAQLHPCDGGASQQFSNDSGRLRDVAAGKCLTVTKAGTGTPITLEPCDPGNAGQVWTVADR